MLIFDDDWTALFDEYSNMVKLQNFPVDIQFEFLHAKDMVMTDNGFILDKYEQKYIQSNMIILQSQYDIILFDDIIDQVFYGDGMVRCIHFSGQEEPKQQNKTRILFKIMLRTML